MIVAHLDVLRQLPLSFVPSLLREAIEYDFKFPAERSAIDQRTCLPRVAFAGAAQDRFQAFAQVSLSVQRWKNLTGSIFPHNS